MGMFDRQARVEILPVSGMLRVAVQPESNPLLLLLEGVSIVVFWGVTIRQWTSLSLLMRVIFVWVDVSTVLGLFYQLSGSEEIEFGQQRLTIRKNILGWECTREYSIENCSELEWRESSSEDRGSGLRCKAGWRTVRFGEYISEEQGTKILTALQQDLPDVFRKMGAISAGGKSQFTTLGLS